MPGRKQKTSKSGSEVFTADCPLSSPLLVLFFFHSMRQVRKLGMMAGGTGITPMLQIISAVMRESGGFGNSSQIEMSLIFANKSEDDILLRDMIEKLVRAARAAEEKIRAIVVVSLCSSGRYFHDNVRRNGCFDTRIAFLFLFLNTRKCFVLVFGLLSSEKTILFSPRRRTKRGCLSVRPSSFF